MYEKSMKKNLLYILAIVLLLLAGCGNEKKQDYFKGTISEIYDTYLVVIPDDGESIKDMGNKIFVSKEVVSAKGVPDVTIDERVQIVYNGSNQSNDGVTLDVVYAIYKESELE